MVWAVIHPEISGRYYPDAQFVGWHEIVEQYYLDNDPDPKIVARKEDDLEGYHYHVMVKMQSRAAGYLRDGQPNDVPPGTRMPEGLKPRMYQFERRAPNTLTCWFNGAVGLQMVETPVMEVIEDLEPGVHQFWSMTILERDGKPFEREFHAMIISRELNSMIPEESDLQRPSTRSNLRFAKYTTKEGCAALTFDSEVIGSSHLWREELLKDPKYFMSDTLKAQLDARGLKILKTHKVSLR